MALDLKPYTSSVLAQGDIGGRAAAPQRATAEDFGGGVAQGMENLARGGDMLAGTLNQIDQDQTRLWASTAVSQKELALRQQFQQHVDGLDPTAPDYPEQIKNLTDNANTEVSQAQTDLMDSAPDAAARAQVQYHMANAGLRMTDLAMQTQSRLNADYTKSVVQQGIDADTDILAASPDNDTYARLLQKQHDSIVSLQTIPPNAKAALLQDVQHKYSWAQAFSAMQASPQGFLSQVHADGGQLTPGGGEPSAPKQPEALAFANQQLAAGADPTAALKATMARFPDVSTQFKFGMAPDGKSFTDLGTDMGAAPQVRPLSNQDIATSTPPYAGWKNLDFSEKVQLVRQAEAIVGKKTAEARGQLSNDTRDALASFAAGKDYPDFAGLVARNNALLAPEEAARRNQELSYARGVGGFIAKVADMPTAQAQAFLQSQEPQGGEGMAVQEPVYKQALAAFNSVQKDRATNPVDYALRNGIGGAQPLDFSNAQNMGAGLKQRAALMDTMVNDYGAKPQIFSKGEVDRLSDGLAKMNPNDRIDYLLSVRQSLGDDKAFAVGMNQLAPKNSLLPYAASLATHGGAAVDVAKTIAEGDYILNGARATAQDPNAPPTMPGGSKVTKFNESQFRTEFEAATGNGAAFQSPDAPFSGAMASQVYNAAKAYYVADQYHQGKNGDVPVKADVQRAVDAVTGGVVKGVGDGGVLFAPVGMDPTKFQDEWQPRALRTLEAAGFDKDLAAKRLNQMRPVNLGDGKYGFMVGTRMLANPQTGRTVVVDYSEPYSAPVAPPDQSSPRPTFSAMQMGVVH